MTGHQAHNQSHGANPLRTETPDLTQQAALIAAARLEGNPYANHLAQIEPKFIAELTRQLDGVDHALIGAVLLTAGQLTASVLALLSPESRPHAGPIAVNLLQLTGQQLYQGKMQHVTACPYPLATGKPCGHVAKGETEDQLDAVMRGHIGLHHPGETWPIEALAEDAIAINVVPSDRPVILIAPPVFHVPHDATVPAAPYLLGAKDAATGELWCGVLGITVEASAAKERPEIVVHLTEIAQPDGAPARTPDEVRAALRRNRGIDVLATVNTRHLVVGFELGQEREPFFDPRDLFGQEDEDGADG